MKMTMKNKYITPKMKTAIIYDSILAGSLENEGSTGSLGGFGGGDDAPAIGKGDNSFEAAKESNIFLDDED